MPPNGIDLNALMQLIQQLLSTPPQGPVGDIAGGTTPIGPPASTETLDPQMAQLAMLLQNIKMQAPNPQAGMQAAAGAQGGPMGNMGGRPRGS